MMTTATGPAHTRASYQVSPADPARGRPLRVTGVAGCRVGGNTVAVRRAARLEAGGWDENVACQDWGLWLRLAHHGKRHARRSHYLACRRIHGQQLTTVHQSDGTYDRDQHYFQKLYSHRWPATPRKSTRPLT
jgi:hypothetical protein